MVASIKKKYGRDVRMSNLETLLVRNPDRVLTDSPEVSVINIGFGVNLYRNAISKDTCYEHITTLNKELDGSGTHSWSTPEPGRNANYFLIDEEMLPLDNKDNLVLRGVYDPIFKVVKQCINDYANLWDISIDHYDPFNFVKYEYPHNNFDYHIDDSPDNVRIVSAVVYLNDNYDGGELNFSRLDGLTIKPKTGDILVFPSNYLYQHESKPVSRGTKYSVAVFTDYKKRA